MKYFWNIYYKILFKIKKPQDVKIHPRYDKHIKYSFSVGNKHYYRFLNDYDIFENRFRYLKTYWQEVENKMTSNDINQFMEAIKKYINDGKYIEAGQLADEVSYRSKWLFEPTSLYKFASVIHFDLQEDVTDYDMQYNNDKIRLWAKKKELLRDFLKELMENAGELLTISSSDFQDYLFQLQKKIEKQQKLVSESGVKSNNSETEIMI
jgi:hydrogenase maturation factor HypF (carbamoyltransferase family)